MKKTIVFILMSMTLLCSCGSIKSVNIARHATEIQAGMTISEVQSIMGKPDYRRFDAARNNWEQWEYTGMFFDSARDIVIIDFRDGLVVSMNSFSEQKQVLPEIPNNE